MGGMALIPESPPRRSRSAADLPALTPSDHVTHTTRSSRAASLHSAVDLRVCAPSPRTSRAASLHSAVDTQHVQVHVRGSMANLNRPRSPRRLTITNV
ncbi:jg9829, partial [Pararge aegeria aegeria]